MSTATRMRIVRAGAAPRPVRPQPPRTGRRVTLIPWDKLQASFGRHLERGAAALLACSLRCKMVNRYACVVSLVVALALAWPYPLAAKRVEGASPMDNALVITIGGKQFGATLSDNPTAAAFRALLPLSISMSELNGNEKLFRLPASLPSQPSRPALIQSGDLRLYGSNTVVLFYKSFATTYSYTRIGRIDDPAGLERAVGDGDVTVTFTARQTK